MLPENASFATQAVHAGQAPDDIDGVSHIQKVPPSAQPGDFVQVKVIGYDDYDLVCEYISR